MTLSPLALRGCGWCARWQLPRVGPRSLCWAALGLRGSGLRLDREAGPRRRPKVGGLPAGALGASRAPCRDAHQRDQSGCAVPGSWYPLPPSQTPGRKSWGHRGMLAGYHPGPQATLDGRCPPPGPTPSPAQPSSGYAPSTSHALQSVWGGVPGTHGGVGWARGGEGRGAQGAGAEVEKAVPGLALRLEPPGPGPWTHFFLSELSVSGGMPTMVTVPCSALRGAAITKGSSLQRRFFVCRGGGDAHLGHGLCPGERPQRPGAPRCPSPKPPPQPPGPPAAPPQLLQVLTWLSPPPGGPPRPRLLPPQLLQVLTWLSPPPGGPPRPTPPLLASAQQDSSPGGPPPSPSTRRT